MFVINRVLDFAGKSFLAAAANSLPFLKDLNSKSIVLFRAFIFVNTVFVRIEAGLKYRPGLE